MRRLALALALTIVPSFALAAPTAPTGSVSASASTSIAASVSAPPSASSAAALPPGHPSIDGPAMPAGPLPDDAEMPAGHPNVGNVPPQQQPEMPPIPQDDAVPDAKVPAGSIEVRLLDEKDHPVAGVSVTLGILHQSVAQGDSRSHVVLPTDGEGIVRFESLTAGSGYAYRISVENASSDGAKAKFSAPPFSLPLDHGYRVTLHRFPVASSIDSLMIAVGGVDTIVEVRDDVVEVQQLVEIVNAGLVAWSLGDAGKTMALPKGAKGLRAQDVMQDVRVSPVEATEGELPKVKWDGSIVPGDTQLQYDFKVPYEGTPTVDLDIEMPPRVLAARVRLAARRDMTLAVDGFPPATSEVAQSGVHILETTKRGSPQDQVSSLHIHVKGLPTQGPGRWIVTAAAFVAIAAGLIFALRKDGAEIDPELAAEARARRRAALLDDIEDLENAHEAGDVGPKAYARERAKLLDALADALDPAEPEKKKTRKSKAATASAR